MPGAPAPAAPMPPASARSARRSPGWRRACWHMQPEPASPSTPIHHLFIHTSSSTLAPGRAGTSEAKVPPNSPPATFSTIGLGTGALTGFQPDIRGATEPGQQSGSAEVSICWTGSAGTAAAQAARSCPKAPHSQRVRRLTSGWSGRCGNRWPQLRRISFRKPFSLRRPGRCRTRAIVSSPAPARVRDGASLPRRAGPAVRARSHDDGWVVPRPRGGGRSVYAGRPPVALPGRALAA